MKPKTIKLLGMMASVLAFGISLAISWLDGKEQDAKIEETVTRLLSARD